MLQNKHPLIASVINSNNVSGLTHNFYRYPARFSPLFVKEAIKIFSKPGDLVLDPFVGGGTTLVESSYMGRKSIGYDISSLATFICQVKTKSLTEDEINQIRSWANSVHQITMLSNHKNSEFWIKNGYQKNINDSQTWRIRNLIENVLSKIDEITNPNIANFLRCSILRTGQWAFDNRRTIPSVSEFRIHLSANIHTMLIGIEEYSKMISSFEKWDNETNIIINNTSAIGLEQDDIFKNISPKLILMSPPYPGVHVLYHRWQVRGRKETPAPFWIANQLDGNGPSYYTFGNRKTHQKQEYFNEMQEVFNSLARVSNSDTTIVQILAFSNKSLHLPRYLKIMEKSGFEEIFLTNKMTHKRIWRNVPNRKWYADIQGKTTSSKEVVLIHKKK